MDLSQTFFSAFNDWFLRNIPGYAPLKSQKPQGGGDINDAWQLQTAGGPLFLKMNDARQYPGMFAREAEALRYLKAHSPFRIPAVICADEWEGQAFLLLEWIEPGTADAQTGEKLGAQLAEQHLHQSQHFGWEKDNYMGKLVQLNKWTAQWPEFFAAQRIEPLWRQARDQGFFDAGDSRHLERLWHRLEEWVPQEPPALVHGDLWAGNYLVDQAGHPVLIDPALHFGHREADLAMMNLFGGFPAQAYEAYQQGYPLEGDWQARIPLHQLYPLLVHVVLFGGGYAGQVSAILGRFGR
jgi:fructosamine-3-kinase